MIEILEKVSEQVKKVENISSGSMPALEGEYYTPPVSQTKVNQVRKLSSPPNLPICFGTRTSTQYGGIHRSMAFPGRRGLGHSY